MPNPHHDAPVTIAIRGHGPITMTRAQRKALIEQVHAVRRANAARHPMPDEDLIAIFRPSSIPVEDYVPRILNPPPPEQDEDPFVCNLPAPSPTPRRKPGRPPKYAKAEATHVPKAAAPLVESSSKTIDFVPLDYLGEAMALKPADPEIAAIAAVHATLAGLDPAARRRVLAYCGSRFPHE